MKRYHVIVQGQVQGVGFRGFVMLQAQRRKLTGSVKNMENGMVEMFVQG
ncbi:MAG: acylphosphatase, partial [Solobacterium sp.]|nr:acylphosphatase [Solobacterium sp.]